MIQMPLKYDKTADTAIRQIKDKRYTGALSGYHDKILLVGINYAPDNKIAEHVYKKLGFQPTGVFEHGEYELQLDL